MTNYNPLRQLPAEAGFTNGDVFVLFGELFGRGYANGIVDEAKKAGMTIVGATVGRRDGAGLLRPLTPEELAEAEANLGGRIINIPLEAGFDMEAGTSGRSPIDQLKGAKPDDWEKVTFDWSDIDAARQAGTRRFQANLAEFIQELSSLVPATANILFAHTMAGGIPRARFFMPILNRVFKGQGDRYLSSGAFWQSDLGRLCQLSFDEVTADTFRYLIDATASLREKAVVAGKRVAYTAYGYHGCEVLVGGSYTWQSYTPYLQGWAKMRLEQIAEAAWQEGVRATVFNCPEIQTNSSALFLGVEISLYPFLDALEREGGGPVAEAIKASCQALLKDGESLERLLARTDEYLSNPLMQQFAGYDQWPQHNTAEQAELMLNCSAELLAMNRDPKNILCAELSRAVFQGVGELMFAASWEPQAPVFWLNHDIIARRLVS